VSPAMTAGTNISDQRFFISIHKDKNYFRNRVTGPFGRPFAAIY